MPTTSLADFDHLAKSAAEDTYDLRLYISGITPPPLNPSVPNKRGDTKTQTQNILKILGQILNLGIGGPGQQELASLDHLFDLTNLRTSLTRLT